MTSDVLDGLTVRRAGPDDTDALCELIAIAFPDNPKADPDVLRWQFWDNPFGEAVSWIAEADDGRIVSHFAVLPLGGMLNGTPVRVAKPADAATLPEAQGKGMMGRLSEAVSRDCAAEGIPITICMPNFRARGALLKVGLQVVGRLRALVRPLDDAFLQERFRLPRPVGALVRRTGFGGPLPAGATSIAEPPADLDGLVAHLTPDGVTGITHDAAFWQWRYVDAPLDYDFWEVRRAGSLAGVAVTRLRDAYGGRFLSVLDLVAVDEGVARQLVGSAVEGAENAHGLATLAYPGSRLDRLARASGMRPLPERLEPQPAILGYLANGEGQVPPSAASWSISWCDLDHV